jgi:hypothetical protein
MVSTPTPFHSVIVRIVLFNHDHFPLVGFFFFHFFYINSIYEVFATSYSVVVVVNVLFLDGVDVVFEVVVVVVHL